MSRILVNNLTKNFGQTTALKDVTLTMDDNKIYGLLGRNGAGKTTLLNIISNRLFPTSGEVLMDGKTVTENTAAQRDIYMMSEAEYYPEGLKIKEIFKWSKEFYPNFDNEYAMELAGKFELDTNKKVKGLSTGYTSIFKLIIALSVGTKFVFFDEPVLGLDANHRDLFYRTLIERYSEYPATYVISTHLIEEVANIIEDVIIIKQGEILYAEPKEIFMNRAYSIAGPAEAVDAFTAGQELIGTESIGGLKVAYVIGGRPAKVPEGLTCTTPDMQKMFIQMTTI